MKCKTNQEWRVTYKCMISFTLSFQPPQHTITLCSPAFETEAIYHLQVHLINRRSHISSTKTRYDIRVTFLFIFYEIKLLIINIFKDRVWGYFSTSRKNKLSIVLLMKLMTRVYLLVSLSNFQVIFLLKYFLACIVTDPIISRPWCFPICCLCFLLLCLYLLTF